MVPRIFSSSCAPSSSKRDHPPGDELSELRQTRRHRDRIARERPCLINRSLKEHVHDLGTSTKGTDGKSADHLPKAVRSGIIR